VARTLELTAASPVRVRLTHRIQPFLAPVLVEGIKPYSYRVTARGRGLEARAFGSAFLIAPSRPGDWTLDGTPWSGTEQRGEFGTISLSQEIDVGPAPVEVSWIVGGGLAGTVDRGPDLLATAASPPSEWARAAIRTWTSWRSGVPTMELPDAPRLERAYDLAASALRTLYSNPSPEITGLVAGFPWYPALWGRDLAWMLPAVLWLGDLGWAEASIRTMFRFQATSNIPLLGAEVGEIPMQISPGPVFLYGTSDTSLYYPDLVRRLVDHGGPIAAADEFWPHLRAIARWAEGKTDRASGLFTNGGEVAELRRATAQIGSIHYGFDAPDTTIWDSTDRRDHAIDVQVHYVRARRALAELGRRLGRTGDVGSDEEAAARVASAVAERYRWREESYLYDSLRRDGSAVPKLRPNALLAISAGLLPEDVARAAVGRATRGDLDTAWGVRTLSSGDPGYDPTAYHDGQVWTIATAWAAEAAFAVGDRENGIRWLQVIADRVIEENGLANECYRGDALQAFDSCFLLGFSVAPFLTTLFERLWGVVRRSDRRELSVDPAFPTTWRSARLRHLAISGGFVDLEWTPDGLEVQWTGPGALLVRSGPGSAALPGAGSATLKRAAP
ncbi:MAG: hypothetical protein L3K06_04335, partial [Thermoplasmata archaeon]|nr:hypothetical protein [Thermoplasmata archaeon]